MKKQLIAVIAAIAAAIAIAQAQNAVVYGTLIKIKNDPKLLEELPADPEEYFIIRFDKPIEIRHENWENEEGKNGKITLAEVHLLYGAEEPDLKDLAALIGRKVLAVGDTMERNTVHHKAPIVFSVEKGNIKQSAFIEFHVWSEIRAGNL